MAEIELSVLARQCLDRRIPDRRPWSARWPPGRTERNAARRPASTGASPPPTPGSSSSASTRQSRCDGPLGGGQPPRLPPGRLQSPLVPASGAQPRWAGSPPPDAIPEAAMLVPAPRGAKGGASDGHEWGRVVAVGAGGPDGARDVAAGAGIGTGGEGGPAVAQEAGDTWELERVLIADVDGRAGRGPGQLLGRGHRGRWSAQPDAQGRQLLSRPGRRGHVRVHLDVQPRRHPPAAR